MCREASWMTLFVLFLNNALATAPRSFTERLTWDLTATYLCPLLGSLALGLEAFEAASWNCRKGPESTASSRRALCYVSPCVTRWEVHCTDDNKTLSVEPALAAVCRGAKRGFCVWFFSEKKRLAGQSLLTRMEMRENAQLLERL